MSNISKNILKKSFSERFKLDMNEKLLVVILGSFGDFDSLEYGQILSSNLKSLRKKRLNLLVLGIGNECSRERFSEYTNLPIDLIESVIDDKIHRELGLDNGRHYPFGSIFNIFTMCLGLNSPGTLSEVLRGYLGDKTANRVYEDNQIIKINRYLSFNSSSFDLLDSGQYLRPFELATRRLTNLIEILSNWSSYVPNIAFLTQRSGTFVFDENSELIYSYISRSLLCYSETMKEPLTFLDSIDTNK
tara:strand:+ start:187 stop:924 length:738 start_codon:yes stop_codon:yes gene_type:complete